MAAVSIFSQENATDLYPGLQWPVFFVLTHSLITSLLCVLEFIILPETQTVIVSPLLINVVVIVTAMTSCWWPPLALLCGCYFM